VIEMQAAGGCDCSPTRRWRDPWEYVDWSKAKRVKLANLKPVLGGFQLPLATSPGDAEVSRIQGGAQRLFGVRAEGGRRAVRQHDLHSRHYAVNRDRKATATCDSDK
jgi:hypothetical protein